MPHEPLGRFDWERRLRDDPVVRQRVLCVLLTLATYHDRRRARARVTIDQLAAASGHDPSRIRSALKWARDAGYLERAVRGHRTGNGRSVASEYVLTAPAQPGAQAPVDTSSLQGAHAPLEADLNRAEMSPQPGATLPLNRAPDHALSVVTPSETSSSATPDDDDDVDPVEEHWATLRNELTRAGIDTGLWDDRRLRRFRDRVWERLGATFDYDAILEALIALRVVDPLAYIASLDDDDLAELPRRRGPSNGRTIPTDPTIRAAISACPHCDDNGWIDADEDTVRRCVHPGLVEVPT